MPLRLCACVLLILVANVRASCPAGYRCLDSASDPIACEAGSFSEAGATTCSPCPVDTFAATEGSAACTPCEGNEWTNGETGSTVCFFCVPGMYLHPKIVSPARGFPSLSDDYSSNIDLNQEFADADGSGMKYTISSNFLNAYSNRNYWNLKKFLDTTLTDKVFDNLYGSLDYNCFRTDWNQRGLTKTCSFNSAIGSNFGAWIKIEFSTPYHTNILFHRPLRRFRLINYSRGVGLDGKHRQYQLGNFVSRTQHIFVFRRFIVWSWGTLCHTISLE